MRRLVLYLLAAAVVLFYVGVGGAAAAPYYSAITNFIQGATVGHPAVPTPAATPTPRRPAQGHTRRHHGDRGTAPAAATTAQPTMTPTSAGSPRAQGTTTARTSGTPTPNRPNRTVIPTLTPRQRTTLVQHLKSSKGAPTGRTNILILGSDNDKKFGSYAEPPTQVMIVLSIDPAQRTVTLLSIPRDLYVHIPGYRYNTGPDGTLGWSKIDQASQLGFDSAACTVESNFGVPIDHWVWVGLAGFVKVVNTMNGLTLDVTHPVFDDNYPADMANPDDPYAYLRLYIPPGPQHLDGNTALEFVRSRHGDVQSDFGRSDRQQIFLTQLRRALLQESFSDLVALLPQLLADFHGNLKTDLPPDLSTAETYLSLLRAAAHYKLVKVVLKPPYSQDGLQIYDYDPVVDAQFGESPVVETAVAPNWPLISDEMKQLFGPPSSAAPHCAMVPGATNAQGQVQ